jgi:hypothetical protein
MATYASILTKCEDAFLTAFNAIAGADLIAGVTTYKAGDVTELVPPLYRFEAIAAEQFATNATTVQGGEFYAVTMRVEAETHGDGSTRTQHGNICGLVEAVMVRSADQIVAEMETANVTDFQAVHYKFNGITSQMDDSLRITTYTATIGCVSR